MAGGQERLLRRRIRSVQSMKKITRAMELISASRIVKAQQRVAAARPYSEQITEVIRNLARAGAGKSHPLLSERETVGKVGFLVVAADRGLAGGYNSAVIRRFEEGDVDMVELAYTQFLSLGTQQVQVRRFIPIEAAAITEDTHAAGGGPEADYEYEPEPDAILDKLLPRYAEARLFAAMLDASASEHAARQRAMKSATDNAEELIKVVARQMNRARQESITNEIMEIVGGAEALSQAASGETDLLVDRVVAQDLLPSHRE